MRRAVRVKHPARAYGFFGVCDGFVNFESVNKLRNNPSSVFRGKNRDFLEKTTKIPRKGMINKKKLISVFLEIFKHV